MSRRNGRLERFFTVPPERREEVRQAVIRELRKGGYRNSPEYQKELKRYRAYLGDVFFIVN